MRFYFFICIQIHWILFQYPVALQFFFHVLDQLFFDVKKKNIRIILNINIFFLFMIAINSSSFAANICAKKCTVAHKVCMYIHVSDERGEKKRGKNKGCETRFSSSCRTHKEQWDTYLRLATHIENQFPRRQQNEIGRQEGVRRRVFLVTARGWRSLWAGEFGKRSRSGCTFNRCKVSPLKGPLFHCLHRPPRSAPLPSAF